MPRYAAIDIGSNSLRMLAAEVIPGAPWKVLASDREVTRLGESVFRDGRLSEDGIARLCALLARMADAYRPYNVNAVRAVATSAVRDASNQMQFLERASEALGSPVEVISGQEESRLIHLGVQLLWPQPKHRILIIDIGGGSAELILADRGHLVEAFSKPLGAVRLTEAFLKHDPPTTVELHQLEEFIQEELAVAVRRFGPRPCDRVIATSASAAATVCAVNRIPRSRREAADRLRATPAQIRRLYRDLATRDTAARARIPGIGPRRAQIIVPGVAVLLRVLQDFQMPSLYYCTAGVREGIISDLAARGVGREIARLSPEQRQMVERMAARYGVPLGHVRQVAALSHHLFESLQSLHGLGPEYGRLLEAAAYLHDVGHFVSDTGHHKHSHYLVSNSDLPGFTSTERQFIAALCRFHRKSLPGARHPEFQSLDTGQRRALQLLIPLLRLADALDRSKDQRVTGIDCFLRNGHVTIQLRASMDTDLEEWAAGRAGEVFSQIYQTPIQVLRARRGMTGGHATDLR